MPDHRHQTPLRGSRVIPHPRPDDANYQEVNYRYAGVEGRIHEVVTIGGRELAKVGFEDRKIVYYRLEDLTFDDDGKRETFHDRPEGRS